MGRPRTYTDAELTEAVATCRSWRGVLRSLGLSATSSSALRSVRRRADDIGADHTHFSSQRRWTDRELADAVARSSDWAEVAHALGLADGANRTRLRGCAARLGLAVEHLSPQAPTDRALALVPDAAHLRRAGPLMAAAWLTLCGHHVSWPLEPTRYDLVADLGGSLQRLQVKTTTVRSGSTWTVWLSTTRHGRTTYATDEIDAFYVVAADQSHYLVPVTDVAGLHAISLSAYAEFQVKDAAPGDGIA